MQIRAIASLMSASAILTYAAPAISAQESQSDRGTIQNRVSVSDGESDKANDKAVHAQFLSTAGKYDEAEKMFKEVIAYWQINSPKDEFLLANCFNNMALLYEKQDKFDQAIPLYQQALAIEEKSSSKGHQAVLALTLDNLAQAYRRQGKLAEAEPLYKRALAVEEKIMKPDDQDHAITMFNLSLLYLQAAKYAECEPLMVKSMGLLKKQLGVDSPDYLNICPFYVDLLRKTNRIQEADRLEAQIKEKSKP